MQQEDDAGPSDARADKCSACRAGAEHEQAVSLVSQVYVSELGKYVSAIQRLDFRTASEHSHAVTVLGDLLLRLAEP